MRKNSESSTSKLEKILTPFVGIVPLPFLGAFIGHVTESGVASGFFWGLGLGIVLVIIFGLGGLVWRLIEEEVNKGKLWPYILAGLLASLVISTSLAVYMGEPTCLEYEYDDRGGTCLERANDGYKATDKQRWGKFWSTLPISTVVASLIAIYVHKNHLSNRKDKL